MEIGQKVVVMQQFNKIITRLCLVEVTHKLDEIDAWYGKIVDFTQYPEYNKISWNTKMYVTEDNSFPVNEEGWKKIKQLTKTMNDTLNEVGKVLEDKDWWMEFQ